MDIKKELFEGVIQELIRYLCEDKGYIPEKAMQIVYNSQVFDKVSDLKTGLYRESPSFVYELLKDEIKEGRIIQKEQ